jgi:nitrate reductase beta subunit
MDPVQMEAMFRMVAIGDYDERYVIPRRHGEASPAAFAEQGSCGIDFVNGAALPPGMADPRDAPKPSSGPDPDFDIRDHLVHRSGDAAG